MAHAWLGGSAEPVSTGAEQGMIVVADRGNNRLQAFYPDGTFAFKFGAGYGGVNSIDIGADGMIVTVGGGGDHGVVAFHPNGTHAFNVVEYGSGIGTLGSTDAKAAIAPDGRIVVADHRRIQVFEPNGSFVSVFETRPAGPDSWYTDDVGVVPDGRIVVADRNGGCSSSVDIRIFHPNGTPALSSTLRDIYNCNNVADLAVAPDGRIVVVHGHYGGVQVYRPLPNGTLAHLPFNGTSYQPGPNGTLVPVPGIEDIGSAFRVAVAPDGRIVLGFGVYYDPDHHVSVFHPNGTRALTFGGYASVQSGFDRPTDAAVAPDGRIVVAEPGSRRISVFHPNGTPAFSFGGHGHGDDAFYNPHQVAVAPDGRIVVGDTGKRRILVFESDGTPALAFGSLGSGAGLFHGVVDVAVGPNGRIVVAGHSRIQVFESDGSSVTELMHVDHSLARVAVGPDGRIMVADGRGEVRVFEANGTDAFTIQFDWGGGGSDGIAVGPDGRIVVVQGSRSQVFSPDGEFVFATEIDVDAVSVAVGPSLEIVVVDERDDRVRVFKPDGTFAFSLRPDLSEGKFDGVGFIAVGPVIPPLRGDLEPLRISIWPEVGGGGPILRNFTNVGDTANVTINVTALAGPGGADALNGSESSTVTFPTSETVVAASFAEVTFPPNVTASHVPAGGRLALRVATDVPAAEQVQAALGRDGGGGPEVIVLLQGVVEVGAEEGPRIMFDLPVRIALEGQAGGRAFYIEGANGTIVPIDGACTADDMDAVHRQLGGVGECQMDSVDGTAKIVHTYHLTKFGTVSIEGPAPGRIDAVDPPVVVVPSPDPVPAPFNGTGGGGGEGQPVVVPLPPTAEPRFADECGVGIDSSALDMSARPGEYSEPVEQGVWNSGTLPLEQVEIVATPWHDGSGPPTPPLLPGVSPPYSGPTEGRTAGAFTAYMIASLPVSVTEVSEGPRVANGEIVPEVYEALADGGSGTAVLEGLEPGAWAPLSFRLNLTPYDGLLAGALVQSVTYQAECVPPAPPS